MYHAFFSYELVCVLFVLYYIRLKALLFCYLCLSLRVSLTGGGYVGGLSYVAHSVCAALLLSAA